MSKQQPFSNPAFNSSPTQPASGFNLISQVNNFTSVFDPRPLDKKESTGIEKLLADYFLPGRVHESQVEADLVHLKNVTAEIKAIMKQGAALAGERIKRAKEILKPYRDGAFSHWIDLTFGSRKTAYNMLAYFELYSNLPNHDSKEKFKKLPQKVAYILAAKDADIEDKIQIIENYHESSTDELMMLIQERFPVGDQDGRRKTANQTLIDSLENGLKKLLTRKNQLSAQNVEQLVRLRKLIDEILKNGDITVSAAGQSDEIAALAGN